MNSRKPSEGEQDCVNSSMIVRKKCVALRECYQWHCTGVRLILVFSSKSAIDVHKLKMYDVWEFVIELTGRNTNSKSIGSGPAQPIKALMDMSLQD